MNVVNFLVFNFLLEMSTLTPAIGLTFGRNRFGEKKTVQLTDQNTFLEKVT